MNTQEVVIKFTGDTAGLEPSVDQLEKLGFVEKGVADQFKKANAEMQKQAAAVKKVGDAADAAADKTTTSVVDLDKALSKFVDDFVKGFESGVVAEIKKTNAALDEFLKKTGTDAPKATSQGLNPLKARLKEITLELAKMKAAGQDTTEQYKRLVEEAGNLQDTLGDVRAEIQGAGSDTRVFDGLISVAEGVASGFAAVQGAIGLAGAESEELQEVLLKVNSAMAVLQGLQGIQNVLQKESAALKLLDSVATGAQTAALKLYNIVVGTSIGLTKALRIAIASTGVGLLVLGLVALVLWLKNTNDELKETNDLLERNKKLNEADAEGINTVTEALIASAKARNSLESDIIRLRGQAIQSERASLLESNKRLAEQRDLVTENSEAWAKLNAEIFANNDAIRGLDQKAALEKIALDKAVLEEQLRNNVAAIENALVTAREGSREQLAIQQRLVREKLNMDLKTQTLTENERIKLITEANREQLRLRVEYNRRLIELDIKRVEESLRGVEAGTKSELQKRQELVTKQAAAELSTLKLSEEERDQIRRAAIDERRRLELAFNAEQRRLAVEAGKAVREDFNKLNQERNAIALAQTKEGTEERLQLEIYALELAAQEERRLAGDNAIAIAAINARLQEQILALKRAQFEQAASDEQRITAANNGILRRSLERQVSDIKSSYKERASAISELFLLEAAAIDKQKQDLRDMYKANLISQEEYNVRYAELEDQRAQLSEESNKAIEENSKAAFQQTVDFASKTALQITGAIRGLFDEQNNRRQAAIDQQRADVDALEESGAITEKEAKKRRERIDKEEKKVQIQQARREKGLALFEAIINTATAVTKANAAAPPPFNFALMAISAALGAAQIAAIASRPIPSFFVGKKNTYEGPGKIGEAGAELVQREDGSMHIAKKATYTWLGSKDIVYNPKETQDILSGMSGGAIDGAGIFTGGNTVNNFEMDYDKMGKAVAANIPKFGLQIDEDGFTEYQERKGAFTKYLNDRRKY